MMFLRANTKGEKLNFTFLGMVNTFQNSGVDGSNKSSLITAGIHADYKLDALTNHAFNGLIDRFYVGNHGNAGGLNDLQVSLATKISGLAVTLTGHYFTEVEDVDGFDGNDLGSDTYN